MDLLKQPDLTDQLNEDETGSADEAGPRWQDLDWECYLIKAGDG